MPCNRVLVVWKGLMHEMLNNKTKIIVKERSKNYYKTSEMETTFLPNGEWSTYYNVTILKENFKAKIKRKIYKIRYNLLVTTRINQCLKIIPQNQNKMLIMMHIIMYEI